MHLLGRFLKSLFVPVTILLVPHSRSKSLGFRIPVVGIVACLALFLTGAAYMFSATVRTVEYYEMQERLTRITGQYEEMKSTMSSLKLVEGEFRKLFGLKSKKEVLEAADFSDAGALDMDALNKQIREAMESATEIRKYLKEQKDIYLSTPSGTPVDGAITSTYGSRRHPLTGAPNFHSGVDLSIPPGTPVKATADGIVSFAGWTPGGGNTVVVEHGYGFSTAYAHNQKLLVKVGQRVQRTEAIAISGSTGVSTGPHVHYEIWKNGRHVNPAAYFARR